MRSKESVVFLELSFEDPHGCSESLFLMFSKMEGKTRFQRSPSSKRGLNYLFHLPDVLQRFRRAQAPDVGHSFLRPFGLVVLQLTIEKQRDPDEGAQV